MFIIQQKETIRKRLLMSGATFKVTSLPLPLLAPMLDIVHCVMYIVRKTFREFLQMPF
jgi:hypothetical protein